MARLLVVGLILAAIARVAGAAPPPTWPEPTQSARPWTRWWWHGSAVDEANLQRLLEEYHRVGLGGVEITCIYGVKDPRHPVRVYRSPEWREAIRFAVDHAHRLGMGVDLPAGSGWRMGDPDLPLALANDSLVLGREQIIGPGPIEIRFDAKLTPQAVVARSADGTRIDLSDRIDGGAFAWYAPSGDWRIDTASYRWAGDRVKRPAPGGEGLNINPYWRRSVDDFLTRFGDSIDGLEGIRATFHDSFEYEGDWQPEFFQRFAELRGYRLQDYLAELAGDGTAELVGRVKADFRQTLDDLVREELLGSWVDWSHARGMLTRNQSHGSPANWLDLYAACDIPEIESYGRLVGGDADLLVLKFASSAANLTGKRLVSSESATWLDEHFHVTLAAMKRMIDRQVLAGVNHVFYHGTAYSPEDAAWPGWVFYASTQLNPQNPIWRDLPALNAYVTRVQSMLQQSEPDADVLLYWPIADQWHDPVGMRQSFQVHNSREWFTRRPIGAAARAMHERGVSFDYLSDRLLTELHAPASDAVESAGAGRRWIVVPHAEHMPLASIEKLAELAEAGFTVILWGGAPASLPGLAGVLEEPRFASQRERFKKAAARLRDHALVGDDLAHLLDRADVRREAWSVNHGVAFLRRKTADGVLYFLLNDRDEPFDAWVEPSTDSEGAALMDPATGQVGAAATRLTAEHRRAVRVQLDPGGSVLLLMTPAAVEAHSWQYAEPAGEPVTLRPWEVDFVSGGPTLPEGFASLDPAPWTDSTDPAAAAFAGTARYTCRFDAPPGASRFRLDLGEVLGSARVRVNGGEPVTLIGPTFAAEVSRLTPTGNRLELEITGVAANRVRDLDRRGVRWKIFDDINVVDIRYRPLDASDWPVAPLGLRGPVRLTPLRTAQ